MILQLPARAPKGVPQSEQNLCMARVRSGRGANIDFATVRQSEVDSYVE
jgi:hypothetical protein